jgi:plasmid stabilization system protein ParE
VTLPIVLRGLLASNSQKLTIGTKVSARVAAVRAVLGGVAEQPARYPEVYEDVREAEVKGYPYCVYYRIEIARILVLAVFHTVRDPAVWQSRV